MKRVRRSLPVASLIVALAFSTLACNSDPSAAEEAEPKENLPRITVPSVPPDGRLEAVTWNLEWYGSTENGPEDEALQTHHILQVMDSLDADLYALQEIFSQAVLDSLTRRMTDYRGFVAGHIDWIQKTAFIFNTRAIDSLSSGKIGGEKGQDRFDWANGRFPLFFEFNYHYREKSLPVYAIVIHAKANSQEESYQRRMAAADNLYRYLTRRKPNAHILLLGDFNDDLDVTIHDDASPSPYQDFVSDSSRYRAVTLPLSRQGVTSFLGFPTGDLIDHIIISDELFDHYIPSSASVYENADTFITDYTETTSDHLPVWMMIDIDP